MTNKKVPKRRSLRTIVGETLPRAGASATVPVVTVRSRRADFGTRSFIEVARKRVGPRGNTTEFLVVSRGFYFDAARKRDPRVRRIVTVPDDRAVLQKVALWLQTL